jgi:hypothetical protein
MRNRILPVLLVAGLLAGCDDVVGPTSLISGAYVADVFLVRPFPGLEVDVLALGGSMVLTIDDDNQVEGTLVMPPFLVNGAVITDLDGDARLSGTRVIFNLDEDTFVRDFSWTRTPEGLVVIHKQSDSAIFTVRLNRIAPARPDWTVTIRKPVG